MIHQHCRWRSQCWESRWGRTEYAVKAWLKDSYLDHDDEDHCVGPIIAQKIHKINHNNIHSSFSTDGWYFPKDNMTVETSLQYERTPVPLTLFNKKYQKWTRRTRQILQTQVLKFLSHRFTSQTVPSPLSLLMADGFFTWLSENKVRLGRRMPTVIWITCSFLADSFRRSLFFFNGYSS